VAFNNMSFSVLPWSR